MMNKTIPLGIILILMAGAISAQPARGLRHEIRQLMKYETDLERNEIPNFSIHLIDGNQDTLLGFGTCQYESDSVLTHRIYALGSLTKPIMGSSFLSNLNDKMELVNPFNADSVTSELLYALLHHRSGLVKMPPNMGQYDAGFGDQFARYPASELSEQFDQIREGKYDEYQYTHTGYAMLSYLMERYRPADSSDIGRLAPMPFRYIFDVNEVELVQGRSRFGKPQYPKDHGYFNSSFGLFGSAAMLSDFIREGLFNHHEYLSENAVDTNSKGLKCSYGWQIFRQRKKYDVFFHSGRTKAYHCYMAACPATKTAVIIMCNDNRGTDDLGMEVLRMINKNWKRK